MEVNTLDNKFTILQLSETYSILIDRILGLLKIFGILSWNIKCYENPMSFRSPAFDFKNKDK